MAYETPETSPLLNVAMTRLVSSEMPVARLWARRRLKAALVGLPEPGELINGAGAVSVLTAIRDNLVARADIVTRGYCAARWLWYLRRTDFRIIRDYLPNTESSIMRIAENLSGMTTLAPEDDPPMTSQPLAWGIDEAALARVARLLAIAELINHCDGWLRRSSKNAVFRMVPDDFPDLVEDTALEEAIDRYDERVVKSASARWHPSFSEPSAATTEPLLLQVPMLRHGIGQTPMWRGPISDSPKVFTGEGRFAIQISSLSDQSNADQMRGALKSMNEPVIAAALTIFAQALMWHATWTAESFGISVPRVGYVLMLEDHLGARIDEVLRLNQENTWPAMEGHIPGSCDDVLAVIRSMDVGGAMSSPGPIIRRWTGQVLMVDVHALSVELMHRLRVDPRTGGATVNATAADFELAVQAMIDAAGASPPESTRSLRGVPLRRAGANVTDIDALMQIGSDLVCVSCKKFELARPYDAGNYVSVRNAKSNVESAVCEWATRMAQLESHRIGDNFDLSAFGRLIGLVVTPELAFVDSPDALAPVRLTNAVTVPRYLSFSEFAEAVQQITNVAIPG